MLGDTSLGSLDSGPNSMSNVLVCYQTGKANPSAFIEGSDLFTGAKLISLKIDLVCFCNISEAILHLS